MESEVNGILVAAHELKAPLNLLRQLAFSLDGDPKNDQQVQSEMIEVSERAIKQVNDLTKIAHLEDGLFEVEPVAIRSVCDDVTKELTHLFRFNHRSLALDYANRSRLVSANRDLLFSIVYNFCLNAMHYSEQESLATLSLHDRSAPRISNRQNPAKNPNRQNPAKSPDRQSRNGSAEPTLRAKNAPASKPLVRLEVRDYGPALPIDVWRSLKKGWLTKPTSIAMRPGSSGLGLYIASKFSQYMDMNVGAIRHRDGTTFFVDLPVSKQVSLF